MGKGGAGGNFAGAEKEGGIFAGRVVMVAVRVWGEGKEVSGLGEEERAGA